MAEKRGSEDKTGENSSGITSVVFGIISVLLSVPFVWLGIIFGVISLVFGIIQLRKNKNSWAITGIILAIIGILLSIVFIGVVVSYINSIQNKVIECAANPNLPGCDQINAIIAQQQAQAQAGTSSQYISQTPISGVTP